MDHESGRQCLLEVDDILKSVGLPFFLMQGTALGAYRDHGFVPSEKDIDLGFLQERLTPSIFDALIARLMGAGFDVEVFTMPFTRPRTFVCWKKYGEHVVHVDIVGMAKWKEWRFTQQPVRDWTEDYAIVHQSSMFDMTQSIELFGRMFQIPFHIEPYLILEYGPDWRIPADDHVSRTRVYNFVSTEGIPHDLF